MPTEKFKKQEDSQSPEKQTANSLTSSLISVRASQLGLIELGLGSILHALKIPFRGHFLSLNQGFILAKTVKDLNSQKPEDNLQAQDKMPSPLNRLSAAQSGFEISVIAALVKSLSPTIDKLGPMLAISLQGVFFSCGLLIFGANFLGVLVGSWFLALYTFVQALFSFFLAFGYDLQLVFNSYLQQTGKDFQSTILSLKWIAIIIVVAKLILATGLTFWAYLGKTKKIKTSQDSFIQKGLEKIKMTAPAEITQRTFLQKIIKDLTRPLFLFTLAVLFLFAFLTQKNSVSILIHIARPIALAVLFSALYHSKTVKRFLNDWVSRSPYLSGLRDKSAEILARLK